MVFSFCPLLDCFSIASISGDGRVACADDMLSSRSCLAPLPLLQVLIGRKSKRPGNHSQNAKCAKRERPPPRLGKPFTTCCTLGIYRSRWRTSDKREETVRQLDGWRQIVILHDSAEGINWSLLRNRILPLICRSAVSSFIIIVLYYSTINYNELLLVTTRLGTMRDEFISGFKVGQLNWDVGNNYLMAVSHTHDDLFNSLSPSLIPLLVIK